MKSCLIIFCFVSSAVVAHAQTIVEDPEITTLMESFTSWSMANTQVRGWRIQILSTTDRRVMEETQSRFQRTYPEYKLIFTHQNPYYHLRTGAFLTQMDSRPLLKKLQRYFPGAFVVADEIEVAETLDYQE